MVYGVCTQFESDGVIGLTKLRSNVFTTFDIDNITIPILVLQNIFGMEQQFFQHSSSNQRQTGQRLFCPFSRQCLKGFAPSRKGIQTVYSFVLKSTNVYFSHLFQRKDLIPFGI